MITFDRGLKIYYSDKINDSNYFSGFGIKELGDGRKIENILKYLDWEEIKHQKLVILDQIHSTNVAIISSDNRSKLEKIEDVDGAVTKIPQVVLSVRTADCVPLIFADKEAGVIGISHQGWRGSLKNMPAKMIDKMTEIGAKRRKIKVAIGPAIGLCCYDINDDRYFDFLAEFDGFSDRIFSLRAGKRFLSLSLLNYLLLTDAGVNKQNIDFFPFCTCCNKNQFFSFRRDYSTNRQEFGEMFSFIVKYN